MAERKIMTPVPQPGTEPFFEAAKEGRLTVPRCTACGKLHWYPRAICPHCMSDKIAYENTSGKGVIYSYSVMRRVPEPYAIAYVTLDEGLTVMTNMVDCDFDALAIGQKVEVAFKPTEGGPPVPMFKPA